VPWKFSSWPPLAPPNWTTTWFSTIPTVSDILQIPCIFAALLSAISPLSISFQRSRMPTLFIVKCVCVLHRSESQTHLGTGFFFSPFFDFLFFGIFRLFLPLSFASALLNLLYFYFLSFLPLARHIRRDLHLHVRSGKERELCGLLSDPQRFVLSRERTTQRGDGTPIDDLPDEEPWRDDHRQTRTQPHALLTQR
jgi:hypothetical protein